MQTATDYIFEQLEENSLFFKGTDNEINISISASDYLDLKRLAKAMEKQQIIDAWNDGHSDGWNVRENHYNPNYYKKSNGAEWYNYEFNYKYGQLKTKESKVSNSEIPNN